MIAMTSSHLNMPRQMTFVLVSLIAMLTRIISDAQMIPLVNKKETSSREFLVATWLVACDLFAGVFCCHVSLQRCLLCETLRTELAHERSLVEVNPTMTLQCVALSKAYAAYFTFEWLLFGVDTC